MEFNKFAETIKNNILDHLPEDYKDAKVEIIQNQKLNEAYTGLTVRKEGQFITPTLNLEQFHHAMEDGIMNLQEIYDKMAEMVQTQPEGLETNKLLDYNLAKDNLFIRVSNAEKNKDLMGRVPHELKEDLMITYHVAAALGDESMASTMVTNSMLDSYGITQEQLHEDALKSSQVMLPAKVESMNEVVKRMFAQDMQGSGLTEDDIDMMLADMEAIPDNPMTVVTNEKSINGAAVIFYPDQLDQISEKLGGDFFILPSSVHEVLVMPDNGEFEPEMLKAMVKEVNETQVLPQDQLADEVYHYDSKDRVFEKAATFEQRQKTKAMEKQADLGGAKKASGIQADDKAKAPKKHKNHDMSL